MFCEVATESIQDLLIKFDLTKLVNIEVSDPLHGYIRLRSLFIQGKIIECENQLKIFKMKFSESQFGIYEQLLKMQISSFSPSREKEFKGLEDSSYSSAYLRAEKYFAEALAHVKVRQTRQAKEYFLKSAQAYEEHGLPIHMGITLFNIFIQCHNLGELTERQHWLKELEKVRDSNRTSVLEGYYKRALGLIAQDEGRWDQALKLMQAALPIFIETGRYRDSRNIICLIQYLFCKTNQNFDWAHWEPLWKSLGSYAGEDYFFFLWEAQSCLLRASFIDHIQTVKILQRYKSRGVDGVSIILIADLAMDRMFKQGDFDDVIKTYLRIESWPQELGQSKAMTDLRILAARAYLKLGKFGDAANLLQRILSDTERLGISGRHKEVLDILSAHKLNNLAPDANQAVETIYIDASTQKIKLGLKEISLKKKPMLFKFYAVLADAPNGKSKYRMFRDCYGCDYNPILHEARMHSLIARAKRLLGDIDPIDWKEQYLKVRPLYQLVRTGSPNKKNINDRLELIFSTLKKGKNFYLAIKDLERKLGIPRRTLQSDLTKLVREGKILRRGQGPSSQYCLTEFSNE